MKCPKCGNIKQLTPDSKRTETSVWRRRLCKGCNFMWLTQEQISTETKMPTDVWRFTDAVIRQSPKEKDKVKPKPKVFNTDHLKKLPW